MQIKRVRRMYNNMNSDIGSIDPIHSSTRSNTISPESSAL